MKFNTTSLTFSDVGVAQARQGKARQESRTMLWQICQLCTFINHRLKGKYFHS